MKKLLIVLCCTALLLVGLFYVNFVAPTAAQANQRPVISAWDSARAKEIKTFAAKEWDCVDTIRRLPGIADASVLVHWDSEQARSVAASYWAQRQAMRVSVVVAAHGHQPIDVDMIRIIGKIVTQMFGMTDMAQISIVDTTFGKHYDGAGTDLDSDIVCSGAPAQAGPDIGKFRLPIEYPLHSIPAESLIDFLTEAFPQVEAEEAEETGNISITASLTDHRTITKMLTEIEREIEALRNDVAGRE